MRARSVVLLLSVAVLLALAVPASAFASKSWTVRSVGGVNRGTVVLKSFGVGHCTTTGGRYAGTLTSGSGEPGGIVYTGSYGNPGIFLGGVDRRYYREQSSNEIVGKAVKSGGRWLLRQRIDGVWKLRGSVSGKCPSYMAATALRLLLWMD